MAKTLAADPDVRVVAVDVVPPAFDLGAAQFVRGDIRNPVIAKVITSHDVTPSCTSPSSAHPPRAVGRR